MRFDLTDLRLFLHVQETGSTAGARRSNMTLASASERVRGMEDTLGVPLLLRGPRGAETDAGRAHAGITRGWCWRRWTACAATWTSTARA